MKNCECTEEDYICDVGFRRNTEQQCVKKHGAPISYEAPEDCDISYTVSKGYRKVVGNSCVDGVQHDPLVLPCS